MKGRSWLLAAFAAATLTVSPAYAVYTVNIAQNGSDVVASGSGSINTVALTYSGATIGCSVGAIGGGMGILCSGTQQAFKGASGPLSFGPASGHTFASASTGNILGVFNNYSSPRAPGLHLPSGYVSGTASAGTLTWSGNTIAGLGLTPGTYTWTWGTGATADSYVLNIGVPSVAAVSPTSGPTVGGTSVVITGGNFTGATAVKFGASNAASFTVDSATQITAAAPGGAAGSVDITVINAYGSSATLAADQFTYIAAPAVTAVSPASGPTAGGTSVIITGSNFTGATAVKFGANNAASFTVNSATQITAAAPSGAAGSVDITVVTPGGTSATLTADRFTYVGGSTTASGTVPGVTGTINASISGPNGCGFASTAFLAQAAGSSGPPPGYTLPYGVFHFVTNSLCSGGPVTVTLTYPNTLPGNAKYAKFGPTPGNTASTWYQMPSPTINGNSISFQVTDGALGDDDLSANGVITDDGGVAVPYDLSNATAVPTLNQCAMLLLSALLASFGLSRVRVRHRILSGAKAHRPVG